MKVTIIFLAILTLLALLYRIFVGDNIKLAAKRLFNDYKYLRSQGVADEYKIFHQIHESYLASFVQRQISGKRKPELFNAIESMKNGSIENFSDLGVLLLTVDAAYLNCDRKTQIEFKQQLQSHLRKFGVPERLITGSMIKKGADEEVSRGWDEWKRNHDSLIDDLENYGLF